MSLFRYNPEIHDNPEFHRRRGYDPNQPRVPAGHDDGGQWTRGGGGSAPLTRFAELQSKRVADESAGLGARAKTSPTQLAYLDESPATSPATTNSAPGTPASRTPATPAAQPQAPKPKIGGNVWGTTLQLFNEFLRNRPEKPVALEFNIRAQEYTRDANDEGELNVQSPRLLTPEEVNKFCPSLWVVQHLTNEAVKHVSSKRPDLSRGQFGSAVHHWIKSEADTKGYSDDDFRFEISYLKMPDPTRHDPLAPARWGERDTKRLDVLEHIREKETVCIYDVKTGARGFQPGDMDEIAQLARRYYKNAKRFVLIEVRPSDNEAQRRQ